MGGATFPTHAKIQSAIGKVSHLIINSAECEPFITANHRLLLESPAAVINGAKILLKALSLRRALIAVEDNKLDAAAKLESLLGDSELIKVKICKTKYPQGDERQQHTERLDGLQRQHRQEIAGGRYAQRHGRREEAEGDQQQQRFQDPRAKGQRQLSAMRQPAHRPAGGPEQRHAANPDHDPGERRQEPEGSNDALQNVPISIKVIGL
jgi:hypothetical protein